MKLRIIQPPFKMLQKSFQEFHFFRNKEKSFMEIVRTGVG